MGFLKEEDKDCLISICKKFGHLLPKEGLIDDRDFIKLIKDNTTIDYDLKTNKGKELILTVDEEIIIFVVAKLKLYGKY